MTANKLMKLLPFPILLRERAGRCPAVPASRSRLILHCS